jgi:photosystem II stability/assembly factor-like uncharacterized protein
MNWYKRIPLLAIILIFGTVAALYAGETRGLALTDLSNAPVNTVTQSAGGSTMLAALSGSKQGIFRSSDGGTSWEQVSTGPAAISSLAVHPMYPDFIFAGTDAPDYDGGHLWFSADSGQTWDNLRFSLPATEDGLSPQVSAVEAAVDQPNTMFMGTWGQGLYRFDVREGFMERLGGSTRANLFVDDVVSTPNSSVYAVTTEGLMRINGSQLDAIQTPDGVVSMAVDPQNPQMLYVGTVGYGVHRSTDGGQTWQAMNNGLGLQPGVILRVPAIEIDPNNPQHIAISTAFSVGSQLVGDGMFESMDGGASWNRIATMSEIINDLTVDSNGVYAATSNGLVRYGQPVPGPEPTLWQRVQSLASPTVIQLLILVVTLLVGGWVLIARQSLAAVRVKHS